ncbi:MAG: flagellar motor switch protein FliG, partial [Hydrogenophaga sp.]
MLTRIYGDAIRPKMARLQWASSRWIADRIAAEHEHMQAVFLAFLPSALASEVIERLPEDNRDLVLMQIAQLGHVEHDILRELEVLVDAYLASLETQSATVEGVRQAAEIINRMPGNRQKVVEQMRARDPAVVAQIEVSMYDFFILSRQTEDVITRIIEASPLDLWAVALK